MLIPLILALGSGLFAKDKNGTPDNLANIHFTVVKDDNGKPVRNASIVLHPVGKDGSQGRGGYQLKTNGEGEIEDQGVPFGKIRIQVLAHGFQTFGQDYDINQAAMNIEIRLKRPTEQFSIYDNSARAPKEDGSPQQGTPVQPPPKQ